jgi:hypothetical protein
MKTTRSVFPFWLISGVLLIFILTGCIEDKFELDRLSDQMELSPKFSAPLARGSITLEDLVGDGTENIVVDSSESNPYIKMVYREDSIFTFDGNDLFEVSESSSESYTLGNIELGSFGPISEVITLGQIVNNASTETTKASLIESADGNNINFPEVDSMAISGTYEVDEIDNFRYADFESGQIEITVNNNLPVEVTAEFTFRTKVMDNTGTTVEEDIVLKHFEFQNIPSGGSHTETFDLSGERLGSILYAEEVSLSTPGSSSSVLIDLDQQDLTVEAQSSNLVISGGEVAIPDQNLEIQQTDINIGYTGDKRIDTIRLAGGGLDLTIENLTNIPAYLEIRLPESRYANNDTVVFEQQITANSTSYGELDLTGSETILTGIESLPVEYSLRLESTQNFVQFQASDQVNFSYNLSLNSDHIDYVSGYFGKDTLSFDGDVLDTGIDLFDKLSGDFTLTDPKLKLFYNNTIGIPFAAGLDLIAKSDGDQQDLNEGGADGILEFKYPSAPDQGVADTILIDKNTSDIDQFISLPPKQIVFSGDGYVNMNTDPATTQNFITSENRVNVGMEMDLPLELKTPGLTYRDSVDFDIDIDFNESVTLYGIFKNQFPFSVNIRLVCRDSVTNEDLLTLEPVDNEDQQVSVLEAPEVNDNGRVISPRENLIYFNISGADIDLLNETNQLAIEATVSTSQTPEGDRIGVKFYTDYTLDFRMGIDETGTKLDF